MNDSPEAFAAAMVAARFADEDARRMAELDRLLAREPKPGELCKRGHNDWVRWVKGHGRRCRTCHRMAMAERRARLAEKGIAA